MSRARHRDAVLIGKLEYRRFDHAVRFLALPDRLLQTFDRFRREKLLSRLNADSGRNALFVETDMTQDESVKRAIATTVAKFGRLDVLMNCAIGDALPLICGAGAGDKSMM